MCIKGSLVIFSNFWYDKCMAKKKSSALSSGSIGSSTGAMEYTKGYIRRKYKRMKDEEKKWKSLNGPITVRKINNE